MSALEVLRKVRQRLCSHASWDWSDWRDEAFRMSKICSACGYVFPHAETVEECLRREKLEREQRDAEWERERQERYERAEREAREAAEEARRRLPGERRDAYRALRFAYMTRARR